MRKSQRIFSILATFLLLISMMSFPSTRTVEASLNTPIDKQIKVDPSYQHDPFDGWGTALVWFGNVTGGWPDEIRNELADALFGEEGLNFNIARYNIGGEDSPETKPYMRLGGAVPGYWNRPEEFGPPADAADDWEEEENWWDPNNPDHWNWEKDENQQWWLKAAQERGADKFEAFSNSPPYFMTNSGYTSGNVNSWDDNLKVDQYENFAIYLTRVVEYLKNELDIDIQTLSPINEPNNGYWGAKGRQEGSNWSYESQAKIINEVDKLLRSLDLDTVVSAMDETNPQQFRYSWDKYDGKTRNNIGQLNVHTYWPAQREAVRDIAKGSNKRLWMSEVDLGPSGIPQDFENIEPGLALSERITSDIKTLEPKAWVLWQAIEDQVNMNSQNENMNWGLIHVDFDPEDFDTLEWHYNKKYYTMGNYTKFIRPGHQFINSDDPDTLATIDSKNNQAVIVYTNHTNSSQTIDFNLSNFGLIGINAEATPYVTSKTDNLVQKEKVAIADESLTATVDPKSVTTFVISNISGVKEDFISSETTYTIENKNSQLVMAKNKEGSFTQEKFIRDEGSQEWKIQKITNGHSYKEKYVIENVESKEVLTANGRKIAFEPYEGKSSQHWIISTSGSGEYSFLNEEIPELLEVGGQSKEAGAEIGLWLPNSGSNQAWKLFESGIVKIDEEIVWTFPGTEPTLPSEITAYYTDGKSVAKEVVWDTILPEQYENENEFTVEGTISNTSMKAKATIYVSEAKEVHKSMVKTVPNIPPNLPEEVKVQLKIGAQVPVPVTWEKIDPSLYQDYGKFTLQGSVEGIDLPATVEVQVSERAIENLALNKDGQGYPKASASFTGRWDRAGNVNDGIYSNDRWTNWDENEWREKDWLQIEFEDEKLISHVKFTFYDDLGGTRPPETLYLEYWNGEEWVEIPNTYIEVDKIEETITFDAVESSRIRAQMTALPNACIAVVEMEVFGLGDTPAISDNAQLESILIDGEELEGFLPDLFQYEILIDDQSITEVPSIEVETEDLFAVAQIDLPDFLPGNAVITVISEDQTVTNKYVLKFTDQKSQVDKIALAIEIGKAKALDASKYTESSWAQVEKALQRASEVLKDEKATQEEVDQTLEILSKALANLEFKKDEGTDGGDGGTKPEDPQPEDPSDEKEDPIDSETDKDGATDPDNGWIEDESKVEDGEDEATEKENGSELPNTATNMYNWLILGVLITIGAGALIHITRRHRV